MNEMIDVALTLWRSILLWVKQVWWGTHWGKNKVTEILQMTIWNASALQWRHNGCDCVSNHQPHHCLLNRLFGRRSKKTSKLHVTGLCAWNSPGTGEFPLKWPVMQKMFPFDDVIMDENGWIFSHVSMKLVAKSRINQKSALFQVMSKTHFDQLMYWSIFILGFLKINKNWHNFFQIWCYIIKVSSIFFINHCGAATGIF